LNLNINISYPIWFILICLAGAFLLSWFLYSRNQFHKEKGFWAFPNSVLFFIRFILIFLISFFLLSPFLKKNFEQKSDPIIIVASDNSQSVIINKDSSFYKNEYQDKLSDFISSLKDDFKVDEYQFDEEHQNYLDLNFDGEMTNISAFLNFISEQYYNKNIGAIVLATDGIYNQGSNPVFNKLNTMVPVYTLGLGDTNAAKDLLIEDTKYNSIAYLNNIIPIEIEIKGLKAQNETAIVDVFHKNKLVKTEKLDINSEYFSKSFSFSFEAKEPGMNRFDIVVRDLENEISFTNNQKTFFIDVIESRKNILILGNSPHPDIAALKIIISMNKNYEVETQLANDFFRQNIFDNLNNYDLVILHQLPSGKHQSAKLFATLENNKTPVLIIIGNQTDIQTLNKRTSAINIIPRRNMYQESGAARNDNFSYFVLDEEIDELLPDLPPLSVPFGKYNLNPESQVLLYQKIGNVATKQPLIAFFEGLDNRYGVIFGTGIWRWPMAEFRFSQSQELTSELFSKSIQFLSVKSDRRYFKLKNPKNIFSESDEIKFDVEFYNQSFEMKKGAEINMTIIDEDGKDYQYTFIENEKFYSLNAGVFDKGVYKYSITTKDNDKQYNLTGEFIVTESNFEQQQTQANHQLLQNLSNQTGGKLFFPNQFDELGQEIKNRNDIKPISYFNFTSKSLIELKWIFFLLLAFFTIEWFFRKFFGSY
jgi:hypothetical protein